MGLLDTLNMQAILFCFFQLWTPVANFSGVRIVPVQIDRLP